MVLDKLFGKKEKFFLEIDPATPATETAPEPTAAPAAPVAEATPAAVAPTPIAAAPEAVTAAPEPAPVVEAAPAKEIPPVTFAADISVPAVNTGRRRPGPSLDPFVRIANEVVKR